MFHYFKIPYITCTIFTKISTINILDPIFNRTLFLKFSPSPRPARLFELLYWHMYQPLKGRRALGKLDLYTQSLQASPSHETMKYPFHGP